MRSHHPAFETLTESELPEFRARGIHLRHLRTGLEVYKLEADDEENSFAFVFRTPPADATGVAHIVEHSTLCGSRSYPLKDPFLVLTRRSLATFINAFTWPDKTVYPAASAVRADFWNLLSVYGDAVFHPLLSRETFLQEAHRLEYDGEGRLVLRGVVYNEMRGDYSSADSLAGTASSTSLFSPGHPYSFDSGGDPEVIPDLGYEAFVAFHGEHYHPSNCRVFFHGDIPLAEELAFLEERLLGDFDRREVRSAVPLQVPFAAPLRVDRACPVAEGDEGATQIVVNWLTAGITEELETFGLELLAEILLGHDGSPLAAALRASDLGEDLSPQCGIDTVFRQVIFSAGLRGTEPGREGEVEELILSTLRDLVAKGIPDKARAAALHSLAFANREVRRGSSTWGLRLLFRSLRGWLHGAGPEATLSFTKVLAAYEEAVAKDPRWLEGLAERWLLGNPHRSTITLRPEEGLLEKKKSAEEARLAALEAGLPEAGREAIRRDQALLAELQARTDAPEKLALIPLLRVADLPREVEKIERIEGELDGTPLSLRPLFTNGIVYLEAAFPLEALPREALPWLPLFSRFVSGAGLPGLSWGEVAEGLALETGGFGFSLDAGRAASAVPGRAPETRSYLLLRLKALRERLPAALDLVFRLLLEADTADLGRVGDLLAELGNDIASALVPAGNSFAAARAAASFSPALAIEELWRGTSQAGFVKALRSGPGIEGPAAVLGGLRSSLFSRRGLRLSLSADPEALEGARAALGGALARLPSSGTAFGAPAFLPPGLDLGPPARHEAYSISAQVGFAAAACRASPFGEASFAHETVLLHLLTKGALWDELRVRRGAYGASAWLESLEGVACFSTYRDPRPADSISWFAEALEEAAGGAGMEAALESVVGASGRDRRPLLPEERSTVDFRRELYGITDEARQGKRDTLLSTRGDDLRLSAARLAASMSEASSVLISNEADVQLSRLRRPDTRFSGTPL